MYDFAFVLNLRNFKISSLSLSISPLLTHNKADLVSSFSKRIHKIFCTSLSFFPHFPPSYLRAEGCWLLKDPKFVWFSWSLCLGSVPFSCFLHSVALGWYPNDRRRESISSKRKRLTFCNFFSHMERVTSCFLLRMSNFSRRSEATYWFWGCQRCLGTLTFGYFEMEF